MRHAFAAVQLQDYSDMGHQSSQTRNHGHMMQNGLSFTVMTAERTGVQSLSHKSGAEWCPATNKSWEQQ